MNCLENGILVCLFHRKAYDTLWFPIHPRYLFLLLALYQTEIIFAFRPDFAHLHGLDITIPWNMPSAVYPAPHQGSFPDLHLLFMDCRRETVGRRWR